MDSAVAPHLCRLPVTVSPPSVFTTRRLSLRAVQLADTDPLFSLFSSDPAICRYMAWKCPERREDTLGFVESVIRYREGQASNGGYSWVIENKDTGTLMGACGFGPANHFTLSGGYILHSAFWGEGYASEAWTCLVDWAKQQPRVYRIEAHHHVDNPASGGVMKNAGMVFEGILRRGSISPNISEEPHDVAIYAWARP